MEYIAPWKPELGTSFKFWGVGRFVPLHFGSFVPLHFGRFVPYAPIN